VGEPKPKSFEISKWAVWDAYRRVKANKGAAGVDGESIAEFERDLHGNLYKLWNRLSSGSYMPPPVRAVEIPKKDGSSRTLGYRLSRTGSLRPSWPRTWSLGWSRFSIRTPMGTGRVGRRWTRSGSAGGGAGGRTGCWILTSEPSSIASRGTSF
jgi:RNA-directed DNA polymerase